MSTVSRRTVLGGAGAVLAGTFGSLVSPRTASGVPTTPAASGPEQVVRVGDARYDQLTTGNNPRWVARPEYFRLPRTSADVEQAVRAAVGDGKRISVRSGGHTFADLTCNPQVQAMIDMSTMNGVGYDRERRAFAVEPGARLLNVYESLFNGWGVTIPGGMCWSVGAGGHVAGGGYGLLSRAHGLVVDHLDAVEIVVVDGARNVRTVVASSDPRDPNHDLWWAHTGGGGGNLGVVTRYWFRSPGASGTTPGDQLVRPPGTVLVRALSFPWEGLTEPDFGRLLRNFGRFWEQNRGPDSPYRALSTLFNVNHRAHGTLDMYCQVDGDVPGGERMLDDVVGAVTSGTGLAGYAMTRPSGDLAAMPGAHTPVRMPWVNASRLIGLNNPTISHPQLRGAHKSALMRTGFSDAQLGALWRHLSGDEYPNPNSMVVLFAYGGQVNAKGPDATAAVQRDSAFKMLFQTFWESESGDAAGLGWARRLYSEFFSSTGGAPVPGENYQGCYVNYPDLDMKDPAQNRSGVPWQTLYYGQNHERLQQIARRWDPTNFFRHSFSYDQ